MKKKSILYLLVTLLIIQFQAYAQDKLASNNSRPLNNINLNLLGDACLVSINYERLMLINETIFLAGKLGIGYNEEFTLGIGSSSTPLDKYLIIPHHITGNLGKGKHLFEFGVGGSIILGNTNQNYLLYPIVGYRIHPQKSNKFNFRVFISLPYTAMEITEDITFSPLGLSVGIIF